jgi:hypothetical protein
MAKVDTTELVRILTSTPQQRPEVSPSSFTTIHQSEQLSALRLHLQSILKTDFDSEKQKATDLKHRIESRNSENRKHQATVEQLSQQKAAILKSLATRRAALNSLRFGQNPAQYFLIEEPFLIWQTPPSPQLMVGSGIAPNNSWMKIAFDTNPSATHPQWQAESKMPPQPEGVECTFYFLWQNDSQLTAVTNISTFLILTGRCEVISEASTFSNGDHVSLSVGASLNPLEWWNQPPSTPIAEQSQTQLVLDLHAQGKWWDSIWDGYSYDTKSLSMTLKPVELNYNVFSIPPNGTAVFKVTVKVTYNYPAHNNSGDEVWLDFGSGDYAINCPYFMIEVLPSDQSIVAAP